jgi:type II secretory pathway component PulC
LLLELLLTLAIVAGALFIVFRVTAGGTGFAESRPQTSEAEERTFYRSLADRSQYAEIVDRQLFGEAALRTSEVEEPEPPPPVETEPTVTSLPLRLAGTAAAHPTDPLGNAVIEDTSRGMIDVYFLGQEVMDGMRLAAVHPKRVLLASDDDSRQEILSMDDEAAPEAQAAAPDQRTNSLYARGRMRERPQPRPAPVSPVTSQGARSEERVFETSEIAQEIRDIPYVEAYSQLSPRLERDAQGEVVGLTGKNIEEFPLAKKFGFKDNDVVTSINGQRIDSEQRAYEVLHQFRNANQFTVNVQRNGRPHEITIRLR